MLIRKLFKAEMAHMVPGAYTTRCHYIHGHSYKYELFLRSTQPNSIQMVADFKGIKEIGINDFFDSFDHSVMVWSKDPMSKYVPQINPERHVIVPFIPTAEMMAKAFYTVAQAIIKTGPNLSGEKDVEVDHVIVHETDTGYASFGLSDLKGDGFPDAQFSEWVFSAGVKKDWKDKSWYTKCLQYFEKQDVTQPS